MRIGRIVGDEEGLLALYSWAGKILNIDLNQKRISKTPLQGELCSKFLGGRGINTKLLWDSMKKKNLDPLGPDNTLIFGTGALTGTSAPCSGRTTITCKSPITNLYLKTNVGGHWGAELKFAGYDHVVLNGISRQPIYIWVENDRVEIREASHLWGMSVKETDRTLKTELGYDIEIACIGPAGEKLVKMAAIMCSVYNAAARGGAGAVMGSKRVKAIVVRGSKKLEVADPDRFREAVAHAREALRKDTFTVSLHRFGTSGGINTTNELHRLPSNNFRVGHVDDAYPISGQCLVEKNYLRRRVGCFSCIIGCHRHTTISEGLYSGTSTGGPEYETFAMLGAGTGVIDTEAVIVANDLCNDIGLDTISTGCVIQWAMESYERGVLNKKDTDCLELDFGNAEALIELISKIGHRQGNIGQLLAEGVRRAADKVGKGSLKWAICNSKGLAQSGIDTRASKGYALAFAVNPRGPDHLHTECLAEKGATPEAVELIKEITGDEKWASPYLTEYRAEIVRWHEDCYTVADSLGFCAFTCTAAYGVTPKSMATMFTAATGIEMTADQITLVGRRILTLEKCYNIREGADRSLDDLPYRLMYEPAATGPVKGMMNSEQELNRMLNRYYELHGWDCATSRPRRETLELLGLEDVDNELES